MKTINAYAPMKRSEMKPAIKARMKPITKASTVLGTSERGLLISRLLPPMKNIQEKFKNMPSDYLSGRGLMKAQGIDVADIFQSIILIIVLLFILYIFLVLVFPAFCKSGIPIPLYCPNATISSP
ncbi:MAG: hypothetical protein QXL94_01880 [Candidatus Parvarchaeum sp.]